MPLAQFRIYTSGEFKDYLFNTEFKRDIRFIQNHHTWLPNYTSLTPQRGEMYWLESMRNTHIKERKWSDIGQHITTFPSGHIGLCRPIDIQPAGILGANKYAICIENFGDFDKGKDVMTAAHKETIVFLNAILCKKFGLQPIKSQVVYHHWFDGTGKRFPEDKINNGKVGKEQKTCPGTDFFGGNTITMAEANFFPLILDNITTLNNAPAVGTLNRKVNTGTLNVRSGPGINNTILRKLTEGTKVSVYYETEGWSKISNTAEEWVFSALLQ